MEYNLGRAIVYFGQAIATSSFKLACQGQAAFLSGDDGTGYKGAYETHIDSVKSQNERIDDKIAQLERYLESREEQLSAGFMKMEEMQSKLDTQLQTLQNSIPKKNK